MHRVIPCRTAVSKGAGIARCVCFWRGPFLFAARAVKVGTPVLFHMKAIAGEESQ